MIKVIYDNEKVFKGKKYIATDEENKAIKIIAGVIKNQRPQLINLLSSYGIDVTENVPVKNLVKTTNLALAKGGDSFRLDFLALNNKKYSNAEEDTGEKWWMSLLGGLFSSEGQDTQQQQQVDNKVLLSIIKQRGEKSRRSAQITMAIVGVVSLLLLITVISITKPFK